MGAVAVPLAVAKFTVMVWMLAAASVTVKVSVLVPLLPSVVETSLMESPG